MAGIIHTAEIECPLCRYKLAAAHPALVSWFLGLKSRHPEVHVQWSWRGEAAQDRAVREGRSQIGWPNSLHNAYMSTLPQSLALDLVFRDDLGVLIYPYKRFADIDEDNRGRRLPILWGGQFKKLGDFTHFQLMLGEDGEVIWGS